MFNTYVMPIVPEGVEIKMIPGYDSYAATSDGRIYSFISNKYLAPSLTEHNYHKVQLRLHGKRRDWLVHRLIMITFKGIPQKGQQVKHLDDNTLNNNLSNLEWHTHVSRFLSDRTKVRRRALEVEFVKDGEIIRVINIAEFARAYDLDQSHLHKVATGQYKNHKGYTLYNPEELV